MGGFALSNVKVKPDPHDPHTHTQWWFRSGGGVAQCTVRQDLPPPWQRPKNKMLTVNLPRAICINANGGSSDINVLTMILTFAAYRRTLFNDPVERVDGVFLDVLTQKATMSELRQPAMPSF